MEPPSERADAETDEDSADSDGPDDPEGVHLPRRLLKSGAQAQKRRKRVPSVFGHEERKVCVEDDSDEPNADIETQDKWKNKR